MLARYLNGRRAKPGATALPWYTHSVPRPKAALVNRRDPRPTLGHGGEKLTPTLGTGIIFIAARLLRSTEITSLYSSWTFQRLSGAVVRRRRRRIIVGS